MTKAAKTKSSVQLSDVTEKLRVSLQAFFPSPELSASTLCAHLKTYMWHFGAGQAANAPSSRTPSQVTRQGSQTGDPQTHTYIYTHTHTCAAPWLLCSISALTGMQAGLRAARTWEQRVHKRPRHRAHPPPVQAMSECTTRQSLTTPHNGCAGRACP